METTTVAKLVCPLRGCGKAFAREWPRQKYCSPDCTNEAARQRWKARKAKHAGNGNGAAPKPVPAEGGGTASPAPEAAPVGSAFREDELLLLGRMAAARGVDPVETLLVAPEDDYKGGEGWVVIAVGAGGRACFLEVDPGFGAMRWWIDESGLHDPETTGLSYPDDPGVYRVRAKAWTSRSYEGEHDMGFSELGPWEEVAWPLPTT